MKKILLMLLFFPYLSVNKKAPPSLVRLSGFGGDGGVEPLSKIYYL